MSKKCEKCNGTGQVYSYHQEGKVVRDTRCRSFTYRESGKDVYRDCSVCKGKGTIGFCFITTATCILFNKEDDCYELEILRKFRDDYLAKNYPKSITEYYEVSPKIVELINISNKKQEIYTDIWKEINDCIFYIENQEYELVFETYGKMFLRLKSDFGI